MENLTFYISFIFGFTSLIGFIIFYKATNYSKTFLIILLACVALQTTLSLSGFYKNSSSIPPRFMLLVAPTILLIIGLFISKRGRQFMDQINLKTLTIFSIIRIPVEIVLFLLFSYHVIPEYMTFEGGNFDIISGITAPVIFYLFFLIKVIGSKVLLIWNFICLGLLLNVVFYALLSIPSVIQQFSFDHPNIAIGFFPFVLLPSCLVPMVLFSHLVSIRRILLKKTI